MTLPRTVGLIGLGLLGGALAQRFLAAGVAVVGHDIDAARRDASVTMGCQRAESAAAVFAACPAVVLSLPTSAVVRGVLAEASLRPGQCILDTTTGDPDDAAAVGAALFSRGIHYLDAAVAGSSEQARRGEVTALVGGDKAVAESFGALFATFARRWFHVGGWGSGARMKLVVNLVLGLNRAVLAEGLALARACGLDPGEALEVLRQTPAYSQVMDTKGRKMIDRDFTPQARLAQHLKDVHLIVGMAERARGRVPLSELHRSLLEQLLRAGHGDEDNSAVIRAFD